MQAMSQRQVVPPPPPAPRFNIHGVLDLDQMANLLMGLMEQIQRQNSVIAAMQEQLSHCVAQQSLSDQLASVYSKMELTNQRLDSVQAATVATVEGKRVSAGELSSLNSENISRLFHMVAECISRAEVEKQYQDLMQIRSENARIQGDLDTVLRVTDELSKTQMSLLQRLHGAEASLANKLDRSELELLQSLVNKVMLYDEFKRNTILDLQALHAAEESLLRRVEEHHNHLHSLDAKTTRMADDLHKTATKKDIHVVAKELQVHGRMLDQCAAKSVTEKLDNSLSQAQEHLRMAEDRLSSLDDTIVQLYAVLDKKAGLPFVQQHYVARTHFDEAVATLGGAVETKTDMIQSQAMDDHLQNLQHQVDTDGERLMVAMRFVEWFTSRGENYEHNMKIIDKHLRNLLPSDVSPTSNTARALPTPIRYISKPSDHK